MMRVWASPAVPFDGGWRAKAAQYAVQGWITFAPTRMDGSPAGWFLLIGRSSDWSAAEADGDLIDPFVGALPADLVTRNDFVVALSDRTLGDLTDAQQGAIRGAFNLLTVHDDDFTPATSLLTVFRRLVSATIEKDEHFGISFDL